jgi:hypothetical protein
MRRSHHHAPLHDAIDQFEADVLRLAMATVRAIVEEELERKRAKLPPAARSRGRNKPERAKAAGKPSARAPSRRAPAPEPSGRGRAQWTRDAIIDELATWMASGTVIDAAFVTRHGPPGLVAAARRIFGRFEAALNVAGLRVSQLYPDGPPAFAERRIAAGRTFPARSAAPRPNREPPRPEPPAEPPPPPAPEPEPVS